MRAILSLAIQANGYLNEQAPWSRMKQPGNEASVASDLYAVLECCRLVGLLLQPLVPDLSQRILDQLGEAPAVSTWKERLIWGKLNAGSPLPQPQPVMARLELDAPL